MGLLLYLISVAVFGLIIGAFARLALPGPDPMSIGQTMAVGVAGSFIAGLIYWILSGGRYYGAGFLASLAVSTIIVYFIRRSRGGGLTSPGAGIRHRRW
jgi:uncharacterized membrane protein YeaQ/YmgE (transglycosylase-associated protein family)